MAVPVSSGVADSFAGMTNGSGSRLPTMTAGSLPSGGGSGTPNHAAGAEGALPRPPRPRPVWRSAAGSCAVVPVRHGDPPQRGESRHQQHGLDRCHSSHHCLPADDMADGVNATAIGSNSFSSMNTPGIIAQIAYDTPSSAMPAPIE